MFVDKPHSGNLGVVHDHQLPIRAPPDIEFHAVGAGAPGGREGVERVLVPGPGPAPVREYGDGFALPPTKPPLRGVRVAGHPTHDRQAVTGAGEGQVQAKDMDSAGSGPCTKTLSMPRHACGVGSRPDGVQGSLREPTTRWRRYASPPGPPSEIPPNWTNEEPPACSTTTAVTRDCSPLSRSTGTPHWNEGRSGSPETPEPLARTPPPKIAHGGGRPKDDITERAQFPTESDVFAVVWNGARIRYFRGTILLTHHRHKR